MSIKRLFVFLSIVLPPQVIHAEPEALITGQQEAFLFWAAGEYDAAIANLRSLNERYPNETRGKAAFYHAGNLIENRRMAFARTPDEAREFLIQARDFHSKSTQAPAQADHIRRHSQTALARISTKLADLQGIERGDLDYRIASESLSDMEASRAAVDYLKRSLGDHSNEAHEIYFLMLVHQADYVDALSAAMTEAYAQIRQSRPELFERAFDTFIPLIEEAANEAIALGSEAIAKFPDSPHRADYHVYLGSGYQSAAMLHMALRDKYEQLGEPGKMEAERNEVARLLQEAKRQNEIIVRLSDEPAQASSVTADEFETWRKQKEQALARITELDQLLFSFQPSVPDPTEPK